MIKAVDTNVLARAILQDDPVQSPLAIKALAEPAFLSLTVVLEICWLLNSRYRLPRNIVAESLVDIIDIGSIDCQDEEWVRWALNRFANGAAIGDMIHLVAAKHCDAFVTFDEKLGKDAGSASPIPVELLE